MRDPDRIIRLKTRKPDRAVPVHDLLADCRRNVPGAAHISTHGTGWHESDINRWITVSGVRNANSMRSDASTYYLIWRVLPLRVPWTAEWVENSVSCSQFEDSQENRRSRAARAPRDVRF